MKVHSTKQWLVQLSAGRIILILLLCHVALHVGFITMPPSGAHLWRQTEGLSIARNYAQEDMNFFLPRIHSRGNLTGIAGLEFPLMNYLTALSFKLVGYNDITPRLVALLFSSIAVIFCFLFFAEIMERKSSGALAALLLIVSPIFGYYSFLLLPDVPALAVLFLGLFLLEKTQTNPKFIYSAFIALTLAALIKISSLIYLPYVCFRLWKNKQIRMVPILAATLALLTVGAWYYYARYLSHAYGNYEFVLSAKPVFTVAETLRLLWVIFVELFGTYLNYGSVVLFFIGIFIARRLARVRQLGNAMAFLLCAGLPCLAFMWAMLPMLEDHDYYLTVAQPLFIMLATLGADFVVGKMNDTSRFLLRTGACLLLLVTVFSGVSDITGRFMRGSKRIPPGRASLEACLDALHLGREQLFVVTDASPIINLFFANRNGWAIKVAASSAELLQLKEQGARYLISDARAFDERTDIRPYLQPIAEHYGYKIFAIK